MNENAPQGPEIPLSVNPKSPFFCLGNELIGVFLPIIGPESFAIYGFFAQKHYGNPALKHCLDDIADETGLARSTVSRSLKILEHLRLLKITRYRGSKKSECLLLDPRERAYGLGAIYDSETLSFSLPPNVLRSLRAEVMAIREKQQGKKPQSKPRGPQRTRGHLRNNVTHRKTSVSPEKRPHPSRGTQTWTHLIQEERRIENVPSPTPSHDSEAQKDKGSPDENEPRVLLKCAQRAFIGVIDDMRAHLLDTNRPPSSHLANGFAEWEKFGFGTLAVERVARRGEGLALVLSARDPAAALEGLKKYHRTWEPNLRTWYGRKVEWEIQETKQTWWNAHPEEPGPGG